MTTTPAAKAPEHLYVYIAGPMTNGGTASSSARAQNIARGLGFASAIRALGCVPFCPHLGDAWDRVDPKPWRVWMAYCKAWVEKCDVLFRMFGESQGADEEVAHARALGIPVVYFFHQLETMKAIRKDTG